MWKGGGEESKKRAKIYRQSEEGKAVQKAYKRTYLQNKKGRATAKAYSKFWTESGRGKAYRKNYQKVYAQTKYNFILNFKMQIGCQHDSCPENNPFLLEFHHPNGRGEKEPSLCGNSPWEEIFRVCKECDLLCCNHHKLECVEKLIDF